MREEVLKVSSPLHASLGLSAYFIQVFYPRARSVLAGILAMEQVHLQLVVYHPQGHYICCLVCVIIIKNYVILFGPTWVLETLD
jgi:hypothetical protein